MRHAPLYVELKALFLNCPRPLLKFILIQLLRTLALAQQTDRRQPVIRVVLRNLWLARFLPALFRLVLIHHKDWRLMRGLLLVIRIPARHATENVAILFHMNRFRRLIQNCRAADRLRRRRFPSNQPVRFHLAPHAPLFALFLPRVPTRLHLLQNSQLLRRPNRSGRTHRPRVRVAKRKACRQKQGGHKNCPSHDVRALVQRCQKHSRDKRSRNPARRNRSAYLGEGNHCQQGRNRDYKQAIANQRSHL